MPKIQLVDDDTHILHALKRALNSTEFQIDTFDKVIDALIALQDTDYAVVIADYRMPKLDGVSYLEWVREKQPAATRLMLSSCPDSVSLQKAINRAEIFRFIPKPWNNHVLLHDVMEAVSRYFMAGDRDTSPLIHQLQREKEIEILEKVEPGITQVDFDNEGAIVLTIDNPLSFMGEK